MTTTDAWARRRRSAAARIEHAALRLFVAHPMETLTAQDVADAAGVSVRTFYRYFPSKEHVLLALPGRFATAIAERTEERPSSESAFIAMRTAIDELSGADDPELRNWQRAVSRSRSTEQMPQAVVAVTAPTLSRALARRRGMAPDELWPDLAGTMVATALVVGARRWAVAGGALRDHIMAAIDMVSSGLDG